MATKVLVFKYKSKKRYRRTSGHRQDYIHLLVTDIQANGESLVSDEDRKRYETWGKRAAKRYEAKPDESRYETAGIVGEEDLGPALRSELAE